MMSSPLRLLILIFIVSALSVFAHGYLWLRLVTDANWSVPNGVFYMLSALLPLPFLSGSLLPPRPLR